MVRQAIVAHARRDAPRECCGFMLGTRNRVQYALPVANIAARSTRYRIDDRTHVAVRRWLRAMSPTLAIIGVYHSHPRDNAYPSNIDIAEAFYPEWYYLIVGLQKRATVNVFRIERGHVRAIDVI